MKYYFYVIVFTFLSIGTNANINPHISISRITPEGGVAYSQVTTIVEDNKGFIWFGTNNGLFSYNSVKIKRYSHLQNNSSTLSTNRINRLYKDVKGRIWVATENGLCSYNNQKDNFIRYNFKDQFDNDIGTNITSLLQDKNGTFWFSDENGFGTLDIQKNRAFYKTTTNQLSRVSCLVTDNNGTIWVFYNDGTIYYLPKKSNTFLLLTTGLKNQARSVLIDKNLLWIGYESKGLLCINLTNGEQLYHFNSDTKDANLKLPSDQVRSVLKDEKNRIWVATFKGIVLIDNYKIIDVIDEQKYSELPNHSIWSLYKDSQKNIWMGTWMGGLAFHSKYNNSFIRYNQTTTKGALSGTIVNSIAQMPNKKDVLIGLDDSSLNIFNPEQNTFSTKVVLYKNEIIKNIKSLAYDKNETLWIGTYGNGILYQKKGQKSFEKLEIPFPEGFQALDILATNDGIWISNYPIGVFFYNFDSKKFTNFQHNPLDINTISNNKVHHIIEDKKGNIWFATQNGLNKFNKNTQRFTHYFQNKNNPESISNNYIYCIYEDDKGYVWIGTSGMGLDKLNPSKGTFENFTSKTGLSGNDVYSIVEDYDKNLWLTTENGLCKFDQKKKTTKSYITNNNFQNDLFYPTTALLATNGDLYFGGSSGMIRFSPRRIIKNPNLAQAAINKIYVNNKEIKFSSNQPIELLHTQNFINFQFSSNNFINPKKNLFKYRLLGFNDQWIEVNYNGNANFTNIPPENYIFEVKTANNDGVWNEVPTRIAINILPPFWQRWYAYIFYAILSIAAINYLRKQVINRQKLKSEIKMEKLYRENEEQLHQMKLQFFTNISHEFRTPLTLIHGPVNRLLNTALDKESSQKQLVLIKNNTNRLLRLINQFLDFRRADSGKLKLIPANTDVVSFCKDVFDCFEEHANHRGFYFHFESKLPRLNMDFDTDKLDKILVNLLSNAFKYAADNGTISLSIKTNEKPVFDPEWSSYTVGEAINEDYISICICDSGYGISAENLPQIFEIFFQSDKNYNRGTGIGLSLSTSYIALHRGQLIVSSMEGKGSVFCICIPQHQAGEIAEVQHLNTLPKNSTNYDFTFDTPHGLEKKTISEEDGINQDALLLITEDNPELLDFLSSTLQNHFRIAKAKNGKEAYQQIHSLYPDLVISDIMMPEMDGVELCAKIKSDIRISHTPVILLTALDTIKDRITGINSGADLYISKPFNEEVLVAQIHNLLNSRKALRSLFAAQQDVWENTIEVLDLDKKFLINAINVVEKNCSNPDFTVENLAEKLHLSRTHLHRKLTSLTDQSATEFIRSIRLKHAVKLMKEGNYLVNEIGYAVGFNSHNYFSKSFRRQFGKTPSEFMKENFN